VEIHLITRGPNRSPAIERLLKVAADTARQQGWLQPPV
jgi:hypothetical protein